MRARAQPEAGEETRRAPEGAFGAPTATLLVVASMVGTGVFTTSGFLLRDLGSPLAVLACWAVGGILALCGALSYAELVAALPRNGGEYQLLARIYHPALGFAAGIISVVVGFAAPLAASALAFGHYLAAIAPGVAPVPAAVAVIVGTAALHAMHVRVGGRFQAAVTAVQIVLMLALAVTGAVLGAPSRLLAPGSRPLFASVGSPGFAVALVYVSFAYSGWNGAAYVAGEMRRPRRSVPIALLAGTAIVLALYLALNAVFLISAPAASLRGVVEVGHVAAVGLLGSGAARLVSALVALVLMSSVSAMLMAGPRVSEAMGSDYPALAALAYRTRRGGPAVAVALQAALAVGMVLTSSFDALLGYVGFTLSVVAAMTVLGIFVLRRREPALPRPYRAWGYPGVPVLFVALSAWMVFHALRENPAASWAGVLTVAAALALYAVVGRRREPLNRAELS